MALLALVLYTPTSTAPTPASAPVTSQPRDLRDSPCVVVSTSKVMPRRCQVSRACSGSSGTTAAGRFQPNRIFCFAPIGALPARLRHQPGCAQGTHRPTGRDQLDPRFESPLARSTSYASLDRSFARIACISGGACTPSECLNSATVSHEHNVLVSFISHSHSQCSLFHFYN